MWRVRLAEHKMLGMGGDTSHSVHVADSLLLDVYTKLSAWPEIVSRALSFVVCISKYKEGHFRAVAL